MIVWCSRTVLRSDERARIWFQRLHSRQKIPASLCLQIEFGIEEWSPQTCVVSNLSSRTKSPKWFPKEVKLISIVRYNAFALIRVWEKSSDPNTDTILWNSGKQGRILDWNWNGNWGVRKMVWQHSWWLQNSRNNLLALSSEYYLNNQFSIQ